eukprot:Lithocolla_globosa_v1_NODE_1164_length_2817_cov_15.905899.p2 type:complete len:141 gc:universal NODE_1164_length_2817_cov_15.905899:1631-1209(-)
MPSWYQDFFYGFGMTKDNHSEVEKILGRQFTMHQLREFCKLRRRVKDKETKVEWFFLPHDVDTAYEGCLPYYFMAVSINRYVKLSGQEPPILPKLDPEIKKRMDECFDVLYQRYGYYSDDNRFWQPEPSYHFTYGCVCCT